MTDVVAWIRPKVNWLSTVVESASGSDSGTCISSGGLGPAILRHTGENLEVDAGCTAVITIFDSSHRY